MANIKLSGIDLTTGQLVSIAPGDSATFSCSRLVGNSGIAYGWTASPLDPTGAFDTSIIRKGPAAVALQGATNAVPANLITNNTGAVLNQNATDGFVYVPVVNTGTPSGVPTTYTGNAALAVQGSTLYFYNGGAWNAAGAIIGGYSVSIKTSDYPIVASDSGKVFTNTGSSGLVILSLPVPTPGLSYTFVVDAAQTIEIKADDTSTITLGNAGSTVGGGNITNNVTGSTVQLVAISTTKWMVLAIQGTWVIN